MDDYAAFGHLTEALRPWLGQLVIVGGWAHRLYWFHPLAHPPSYAPLRTQDADVAFSRSERLTGNIGAALKAADFREQLSTDHSPPVSEFVLGTDNEGFYAEFLTPLHGSGVTRKGKQDVTVTHAGVTAQKLRYLDLLLTNPWTARLTRDVYRGLTAPTNVSIANPAAFIVQKLLIHAQRRPNKQAQDVLYIHDTLQLFAPRLNELNTLWRESVRPALPATTAKRVHRLAHEQFSTVTETIRAAVKLPADRTISPERLQAACALGLEDLLDSGM